MRVQKGYIGYCIAMWILWLITLIFIQLLRTSWDFYSIAFSFAYVTFWVVLIPVHWILGIWALVFSIKNQKTKYAIFNSLSICVNAWGGLFMLIPYVGLVG